MSDVVPLNHNRRLTPEEYEQERLSLRETYGDSKRGAGVRYEQELARLFARSGWTQEELAKKEGRSQNYVSAHLCFGRFVKFIAGRNNFQKHAKKSNRVSVS